MKKYNRLFAIISQSAFYSNLRREGISDGDYDHAQNVWTEFRVENLGEYHDLYLVSDILLLADVFTKFRGLCITQYGLDCAHFHTLPGI